MFPSFGTEAGTRAKAGRGCARIRYLMRYVDLGVILVYLVGITWFGA